MNFRSNRKNKIKKLEEKAYKKNFLLLIFILKEILLRSKVIFFTRKWKYFSIAIFILVLVSASFSVYRKTSVKAATFDFLQSMWQGVPAGSSGSHPDDQSDFTDYTSKTDHISLSGGSDPYESVTIAELNPDPVSHTLDADFNSGSPTKNQTTVSGNSVTLSPLPTTGDGSDGSVTISSAKNINTDTIAVGRTCADGISYNVISLTANTATLSAAPPAGCFSQGDQVMLANMQGDGVDVGNVGNYEILEIQSISGDQITFTENKTKYYGDGTDSDDSNLATKVFSENSAGMGGSGVSDVGTNSIPTLADLNGDGLDDLVIGVGGSAVLTWYRNNGNASAPVWENVTASWGTGIASVFNASPSVGDVDEDGLPDLAVGNNGGTVVFYKNVGTTSVPAWQSASWSTGVADVGINSTPFLVDLDADGDLDLIIGNGAGYVSHWYRNNRVNPGDAPIWEDYTNNWKILPINPDLGSYARPAFVDLDGDSDYDLVVGEQDGVLNWYRNTGSASSPSWSEDSANLAIGISTLDVGDNSAPTFGNLNGDGHDDLIVGKADGTLSWYSTSQLPANITQKVILQRVPQYADVTISSGGSLTASDWDGSKGGVLAFLASGTVTVDSGGSVTMTGKGYRGTAASVSQGESYNKTGIHSQSANLGGGGAYNNYDPFCTVAGSAGGGYGTVGETKNLTIGGSTYGDIDLNKIYLGSAGGYVGGSSGGDGGGVIYIAAEYINSTNGNIVNNGQSPTFDNFNPNGGGSGGSIYLMGNSINLGATSHIIASGGSGSSADDGCGGTLTGGNGGVGRIHVKSSNISGSTTPAYASSSLAIEYYDSGTFVSGVLDTGQKTSAWGNLTWNATLSGETVSVKARTCDDAACSGEDVSKDWDSVCTDITSGSALSTGGCATVGDRYVQYQATLSTTDSLVTPTLDDVSIGYSYYPTDQNIVSSWYDAVDSTNFLNKIIWDEDEILPSGTGIKFQVQTAPDSGSGTPGTGTGFVGPDGTSGTYFSNSDSNCSKDGQTVTCDIPDDISTGDGSDDQWIAYRTYLTSEGQSSPQLDEVILQYVVNGSPIADDVTVVQNSSGSLEINYYVFDGDNFTQTISFGLDIGITLADNPLDSGSTSINIDGNYANLPSGAQTIQIDQEQIHCDSRSGSVLSSCTRGYNNTRATSHNQGETVWFVNTDGNVSGDAGAGISNEPDRATAVQKSATWDIKSDLNGVFNASPVLRVMANDGQLANQMSLEGASDGNGIYSAVYSDVSFELDTKNPSAPLVSFNRSEDSGQIMIGVTEDSTSGIEYALAFPNAAVDGSSDPCDFSAPDWQSFTYPSQNITVSDNNDEIRKVCVIFKDMYGNTSSNIGNYAITPKNPSSAAFKYYDVSNVDIGDYRLFLSWEVPPDTAEGKESGSNGFSSYEVQRCSDDVANPDCTPDTIYETIVSKLENSLTDNESGTGLDPDMRYCYRYRVKDSNPDPFGDYSKWSDTLCVVPGSGTSSITKNVSIHWYPTAEENVPSDKVYTTQATVRWQTVNAADPNEAILSDSTVWWRVQGSSEWTESYSISSYVEDHSVTIPGRLSPGTTYEYRVTSTTPWGTSDTTNGTSPATFTTKLGPVIRNVQTSSVGNTNAAVEWDTEDQNGDPVNATSVLYYSVALDSNGNLVAPQTGNCSGGYSSHHVCTMTDLVSGYHYYYYVYSVLETDPDGFAADTNGGEYYRFTTTTDTTPPLITPDAGNPLILTDTQAALSFETNERAESWLLYGTTSNSGASFPSNNFDPDNVSHNPYDSYISSASPSNLSHTFVFSLDSLDPETAYYYRFVSEDVSGNASAGDEESFTTLPVQVDQHDPLSSISTPASADDDDSADITRGETFAFVSWTTDQPANQSLSCSETQGGPYTLTTSDLTSYNMSHTLKIISLSPDRQYFCQVVSEDDLVPANSLASSEFSFTTLPDAEFQHDPLSEISDVEISSLSDDSATIVFDTDQSALCVIESGAESGNYTNEDAKEHGYDEKEKFNRHHNIKIENLSASTKYYYQISCEDNLETEITSSEYDFTTNASPDVSGPEILDPMVTDLTYKTATIEWTTDESGNSLVDYGTTTEYGESYGESIRMSTSHSVTLPNLKPLTKYYFQVKSFDANGNQEAKFTDDDGALLSFTTLSGSLDSDEDGLGDQLGDISDEIDNLIKNYEFTEAEIKEALAKIYKITSDGPSANVSGTTVAISWKTSRSSDGKVVYWQDGKSEDSASSSTQIGEESTDHEVIIKNLNAQTTYSYYVSSSTSLGSEITSGTNTFTTGDTPGIFGISVKDITLDSATVTWATDSVESSRVEYGTSINYSQEKTSDESAGQEHSAFLTGLQTGQEYHFRIKGTDSNDEEIVSGDHMFIVLSKPEISDIEVRDVSTEKAVISWKTNTGTDSLVEYKIKGEEEGSSQGKMEAVTDHEIILESLVPGTDYEFKVVSKDQFSNISESEMSSFTTVEDNSAPRINSVKSEATVFPNKDSKIQTIISWVTDKPSNSIIAYKEGRIDKDDGINEKIRDEEADEFNGWKIMRKEESLSNHMFVFTEFKPSSIYYFKVGNVDKRGNISISDNYSILTPAKNKSVLDLIISNFEDTFGWLKQIGGKN